MFNVSTNSAVLAKEMVEKLAAMTPQARRLSIKKVQQVAAKFWRQELSGPATDKRVGVGTGHLRGMVKTGSINPDTLYIRNAAAYAAAHEYGDRSKHRVSRHQVREHTRESFSKTSTVRAHFRGPFERQANLPERPHMRPAIERTNPHVLGIVAGEVDRVMAAVAQEYKLRAEAQRALGKALGPAARRTR